MKDHEGLIACFIFCLGIAFVGLGIFGVTQCARDYNAGVAQVEMLRIEKGCSNPDGRWGNR